jgi:hypothetical protein
MKQPVRFVTVKTGVPENVQFPFTGDSLTKAAAKKEQL